MENNENPGADQGNVLDKYHKQKAIEEIKSLFDGLKDAFFDRGKPVKSIPMRAEWKKAWEELAAARVAHEIADRRANNLKDFFWGMVHKDLDDMRGMHYNEKVGEIEIFDDIEKNES